MDRGAAHWAARVLHPVNKTSLDLARQPDTKLANREYMRTLVDIVIRRRTMQPNHLNARAHELKREHASLEREIGLTANFVVLDCPAVEARKDAVDVHPRMMRLEDPVLLHTGNLIPVFERLILSIGIGRKEIDVARHLLLIDIGRRLGSDGDGSDQSRLLIAQTALCLQAPSLKDKLLLGERKVDVCEPLVGRVQLSNSALMSTRCDQETQFGVSLPARHMLHWHVAKGKDFREEGLQWEVFDGSLSFSRIGGQIPSIAKSAAFAERFVHFLHFKIVPGPVLSKCQTSVLKRQRSEVAYHVLVFAEVFQCLVELRGILAKF